MGLPAKSTSAMPAAPKGNHSISTDYDTRWRSWLPPVITPSLLDQDAENAAELL